MPIPKNVTFVTFDVYGTLIDWETGIYEAFSKEAARDDFEIDRAELMALFHEISREIEAGSYELYGEVLRRTAIEIADRLNWQLEPSRPGWSSAAGKPLEAVPRAQRAAGKAGKEIQPRAAVQHRRQALRADPPPHPDRLRPRRHRSAGPLLQARAGALHRVCETDRR